MLCLVHIPGIRRSAVLLSHLARRLRWRRKTIKACGSSLFRWVMVRPWRYVIFRFGPTVLVEGHPYASRINALQGSSPINLKPSFFSAISVFEKDGK
jgi:hypothetical protein